MKFWFVSSFLFLQAVAVHPQYPFIDAELLKSAIGSGSANFTAKQEAVIGTILAKYLPEMEEKDKITTAEGVVKYFAGSSSMRKLNPFFGAYLNQRLPPPEQGVMGGGFIELDLPSSGPNLLPGLDLTTIVDKLAVFLLKRAEQDGVEYYLDRFQSITEQYPEIPALFEDSTRLLRSGAEGGNYALLLPALPQTFRSDLEHLAGRLIKLSQMNVDAKKDHELATRISSYKKYFEESPETFVFNMLAVLSEELLGGISPPRVLADLDDRLVLLRHNYGLSVSQVPEKYVDIVVLSDFVSILRVVSDSLVDPSGRWVSQDRFNRMMMAQTGIPRSPSLADFYIGLVYELLSKSESQANRKDDALFRQLKVAFVGKEGDKDATETRLNKILTSFGQFSALVDGIESARAAAQESEVGSNDFSSFQKSYVSGLMQLVDKVAKSDWIVDGSRSTSPPVSAAIRPLKNAVKSIEESFGFIEAVQSSNYQLAFSIVQPHLAGLSNYAQEQINSISETDKDAARRESAMVKDLYANVVKLGVFAGALSSSSQNPSRLEQVISTFALPAASYRTKYQNQFSLALNAYLGGHVSTDAQSNPMSFGPFVPVGVSTNVAGNGVVSSVSLYLGLVDLGAIAAFRLNAATARLPDLTWTDILSPSASIVFDLGRSPLALGTGVRIGPSIGGGDTSLVVQPQPSRTVQFFIFGAIDLPLFLFYSR